MIITPYNNHVGSFLPGLGWLAPPKSIRAWEPTLLWNQLHSSTFHKLHHLALRPTSVIFRIAIVYAVAFTDECAVASVGGLDVADVWIGGNAAQRFGLHADEGVVG